MSENTWSEKHRKAQATAQEAITKESQKDLQGALSLYVEAIQLHLNLAKLPAPDAQSKQSVRDVASKLINRAEKIKALLKDNNNNNNDIDNSSKTVSTATNNIDTKDKKRDESISLSSKHKIQHNTQEIPYETSDQVLQRSSNINNSWFPVWSDLSLQELTLDPKHNSPPQPSLMPTTPLATWTPAAYAMKDAVMFKPDTRGYDIYQDIVTDCSLVSSLIVCFEHHLKFGSMLPFKALFPQDRHGYPRVSHSGIYEARFFINGTFRKVVIDDKLPVVDQHTLQCASTRARDQLWPSLLEKAYMKWSGGYQFRGSNSSIDIHALSGWIPEHIEMHSAAFQREKSWDTIYKAFDAGRCLLTVGTGNKNPKLLERLGLVTTHQYAVLDVVQDSHSSGRKVLLINPWNRHLLLNPWNASSLEQVIMYGNEEQSIDNAFWVEWDNLCSYFDSLFLNWDFKHFTHHQSLHACARKEDTIQYWLSVNNDNNNNSQGSYEEQVDCSYSNNVWILLTRHVQQHDDNEENNYIMLNAFSEPPDGSREPVGNLKYSTSFVNSPHILVRLNKASASNARIVTSFHCSSLCRYTMSVYSTTKFQFKKINNPYVYSSKVDGTWKGSNTGGNHTYPTFMDNPQYKLAFNPDKSISNQAKLLITLKGPKGLSMNVKLVRSDGQRVSSLSVQDIAGDSGAYSHGLAICETGELNMNRQYALVLSTFSPRQEGDYHLNVQSTVPLELSPIETEGAGMYQRRLTASWDSTQQLCYELDVPRTSKYILRLQRKVPIPYDQEIQIFSCKRDLKHDSNFELDKRILTSYRDFGVNDHPTGVCTGSVTLPANDNGYIIVPKTWSPNKDESLILFVYSDSPIGIKPIYY